jgi:hypothetical protein
MIANKLSSPPLPSLENVNTFIRFHNILTRVGVAIRLVLDWIIGFINTLYTVLGTTGNYSAIAILHTLQFTVTHTLRFPGFTSRILATDLSVSLLFQITHEVFFSQPNSFITIILQLSIPKTLLSSNPLFPNSYAGRLASRNSTDSTQMNYS